MNSNSTSLDISSFFTYNEGINYIHSLDKCNSDTDCPQDSSCISNNCVVTFYCNDKDKCAFYETLCDGKPCKKEKDLSCKSNDDCLSGECFETECTRIPEYISGTFTFMDGYNYHKSLNECTSDIDCPNQSNCIEKRCVASFYCKEFDDNVCSFGENLKDGISYNNDRACKVNDDCLSGICTNGICNRTRYALVSKDTKLFGLDFGDRCTKNSECYSNYCSKDGTCGKQQILAYGFFFMFIILDLIVLFIVCTILCCCWRRNKKNSKK